ncbi:response regulator [Rivularia sp. UHCC 0363]|uniref:response regulator n=1 Tax=Rivularia sp. UHCC 0363 TaxID=3110244 RepID=UPI002B1F5956|nr:response regulator [Rivularia sp. UHCC 0363]MEA5598668.1 response regulator [Rivularia sp. UHCC 0363]
MQENDRIVNVLLVEDDEVDIMNVERAFKKAHINNPLYVARNGIEALTMLRGENQQVSQVPNERRLILLDINMPKMSGLEFLQALRADKNLKLTPVVMLTTSNQDRDMIEAFDLNVAGYLLKPVTFSKFVDLMATLNRYWSSSEMPN